MQPPRILDTHVHVWRYSDPWMDWLPLRPADWNPVKRDIAWEELQLAHQSVGVEEMILVEAATQIAGTVDLLATAASRPSIRAVVGWVSVQSPRQTEADLAALDGHDARKLAGIRNNHTWEPDGNAIETADGAASCRLLAERGLSIDLHVPDYSYLESSIKIAERVPEAQFVINHMGKPLIMEDDCFDQWAEFIRALGEMPHVSVKFSGWTTFAGSVATDRMVRYFDHAVECFGPQRLMYASNWPVVLVSGTQLQTHEAARHLIDRVDVEDRDAIWYATGARVYRIDER